MPFWPAPHEGGHAVPGEPRVSENLSILIVDDDLHYRSFLAKVIEALDGVELVPPAANGRIALARLQSKSVDLVLLDMQMPEMSGLEVLRRVRENHPDIGVIMISGAYASDADVVVEALELGALDFLPKTPSLDSEDNMVLGFRSHLRTLFHQFQGRRNLRRARKMASETGRFQPRKDMAGDSISTSFGHAWPRQTSDVPTWRPGSIPSVRPGKIDVVVIGASTGGPNALSELIPRLPGNLRVPVLIVQHMPAFLTASLADSLNAKSEMDVHEAVDGEILKAGSAYIAPGGTHLTVASESALEGTSKRRFIRLDHGPPENSVRPSADVLFRSVAESFQGHTLAVIMTGMGNDGMKGVRALKQQGCYCLAQSEDTCVVYGMPRAVDEAALSDERVELPTMADRMVELIDGSTREGKP